MLCNSNRTDRARGPVVKGGEVHEVATLMTDAPLVALQILTKLSADDRNTPGSWPARS